MVNCKITSTGNGHYIGGSWSNSGSPTIVDCTNFGTVR